MSATAEQVAAGQAVYTRRVLRAYDFFVLGVSNRVVWRCPTPRLLAHYDAHVTANHLDVGVGTGFYLDHCRFPSAAPRIALVDLNPETLDFASHRIARYEPIVYRRNVLEPFSVDGRRFDSVGVNYLLHCLPGSMQVKSVVFDHLKQHMNPGAVIFGSTLLSDGAALGWLARGLMKAYNKKGIFSNRHDTWADLERALESRFRDVSMQSVGCAAVFAARA
jgi:2-polyprenyl-3-methyl-5-hydroxy-6-metoxy-1,4-benzoquinol methylase